MAAESFGAQLRSWRLARRVSQEALAARAGVSPRHLSFVENGRSRPSREVVIALATALEVPLRDRNTLLTAAGFAAAFRASPLDAAELAPLRRAIDHVLAQQEPYGAVVLDACWNLQRMNRGAARVFRQFPPATPAGLAASQNLFLGLAHPEALQPYVVNWSEVAPHLVARLHHEVTARPEDEAIARLRATVLAQPTIDPTWRVPLPGRLAGPFVSIHLRSAALELRLFSMLTSIGTPLDVTAEELHIETYFPADAASEAALRALA